MTTMRAIKSLGNGKTEIRSGLPVPALRPDYVTVKTAFAAINPTDWMHRDFLKTGNDTTLGCDFSGTIVDIGSSVLESRPDLKVGDRVYGFAHGGNVLHSEDGAFGEYLTAKGDLLLKIPEGSALSLEGAVTMGVGVYTNAQGLYQKQGLPFPPAIVPAVANGEKPFFLVYGGSTATGMHGIQFAKASGFSVIATVSPKNFELAKRLGADHVFDYSSPTVGQDINNLTNDGLMYAWDTISQGASPAICAVALASKPIDGVKPKYGTILWVKDFPRPAEEVDHLFNLAYTIKGEAAKYNELDIEAVPEDFEFAKSFRPVIEQLVGDGKVKAHRYEVKGGLEDIEKGMEDMKQGMVSGVKWVYKI